LTASSAEPEGTLSELASVRSRTRRDLVELESMWFPLVLFGALQIASAPFALALDGAGVALFWVIAAPAGFYLNAHHYREESRRVGLAQRHDSLWPVLLVVFIVAVFLAGALGGAVPAALVVSAAYFGFGLLGRSRVVAATAVALGAGTIVLSLAGAPGLDVLLPALYGAVCLALGLALRPA